MDNTTTTESIYKTWENICEEIVSTRSNNWKQNPCVTYMLEHVSDGTGKLFLEDLLNEHDSILTEEVIERLCSLNDLYGNTHKVNYYLPKLNKNFLTSPSSLRYIRHAFDICKLIQTKNTFCSINIIEIGGGYGGLCLILNMLASLFKINIQNYYIYDLPSVQKLQQYYLDNFMLENVVWMNSSTFGEDFSNEDDNIKTFLISNYCISEIPIEFKNLYFQNLLPKVSGGYFAWNSPDRTNLPNSYTEELEKPSTSNGNVIIRF